MRRIAGFSLIATVAAAALVGCDIDINFDRQEFNAVPLSLSAPAVWPPSDTLRIEFSYRYSDCDSPVGQTRDLTEARFSFSFRFEERTDKSRPHSCTMYGVSDVILLPPPRADSFVVLFSGQGTTLTATVKRPE